MPAFRKPQTDAPATAPEPVVLTKDGGKGRATPRRRDQQAARRQPLVTTDRKGAKTQSKTDQREARMSQRQAMARGDEKALMPRDRGPVKRYIRDYVDARLRIGEVILPLMLVMLLASVLLPNTWLRTNGLILVWIVAVVSVVDAALNWRRCKKRIVELTGNEPPKGSAWYCGMRAFQMRFSRMPKPQVARSTPLDEIRMAGQSVPVKSGTK